MTLYAREKKIQLYQSHKCHKISLSYVMLLILNFFSHLLLNSLRIKCLKPLPLYLFAQERGRDTPGKVQSQKDTARVFQRQKVPDCIDWPKLFSIKMSENRSRGRNLCHSGSPRWLGTSMKLRFQLSDSGLIPCSMVLFIQKKEQ